MRLKYTIGGVVLVLVSPLFCHSLLTLPLEAKLTLVTLSPTIVTMKSYGLRLRLGMGMLCNTRKFHHNKILLATWLSFIFLRI
jgi:hypothetical protein